MELRQMATAFLFNEEHVLMMRKENNQLYPFEFWTGLGGHLEQRELNHPRMACLREIEEESGITESKIQDFKLRYILLRVKEDEIRQQFVYFGKTQDRHYVSSEEGELYWVDENELLTLRTSRIINFMLQHYFDNPDLTDVMIGVIAKNDAEEPIIQWSILTDPHLF
jgi:8-oxo-dGTP diphosphatase